jgi:hypothetical protein
MGETKELGELITVHVVHELSECVCGRRPRITQRREGLFAPWRAECGCGFVTPTATSKMHAAVKWEKVTRQLGNI